MPGRHRTTLVFALMLVATFTLGPGTTRIGVAMVSLAAAVACLARAARRNGRLRLAWTGWNLPSGPSAIVTFGGVPSGVAGPLGSARGERSKRAMASP